MRILHHKIDGEGLLYEIQSLLRQIITGWAPTYPQPAPDVRTTEDLRPVTWVRLDKEHLARLQTALAIQLKLLNKVLPDLKALDMSATVVRSKGQLDDRELLQRLESTRAMSAYLESGGSAKRTPLRAVPSPKRSSR